MAFHYSPKIVTDGLTLYLDAGNPKSFPPGSGTTWTNLINPNENIGTLVNGPVFDSNNVGSIKFDGSNDYVQVGTTSSVKFLSQFTINIWAYCNADLTASSTPETISSKGNPNNTSPNLVIYFRGTASYNGIAPFIASTGGATNFFLKPDTDLSAEVSFNWSNICITRDFDDWRLYYNGNLVDQHTDVTSGRVVNNTTHFLKLGVKENNSYMDGNIGVYSIYESKVLNAQEVLQNYNALKSRYYG